MKVTLKTATLQDMVTKAMKGASCNKLILITSLMEIKVENGVLTLTTTNGASYLKIKEKGAGDEDFCVVVEVGVFSKLVAKTTSESITLELKETSLIFHGNGTYNIELPLDENGNLIKYPAYKFQKGEDVYETKLSVIKNILTVNKASVAKTMEVPQLTGYFLGESVYSTDSYLVCANKLKFLDKDHDPLLIHADLMSLLEVIDTEEIRVYFDEDKVLFESPKVTVYGTQLSGIEDYPVDALESFVKEEFESSCVLPKTVLLNVLDRMALFVTPYDKNGVYLKFTKEGVLISSRKQNGTELIKYESSENFKDYMVYVDIEMLKSQVSVQPEETVKIHYGTETAIKLTNGNVTQIIALLEDEDE